MSRMSRRPRIALMDWSRTFVEPAKATALEKLGEGERGLKIATRLAPAEATNNAVTAGADALTPAGRRFPQQVVRSRIRPDIEAGALESARAAIERTCVRLSSGSPQPWFGSPSSRRRGGSFGSGLR